jgi:hypothetical protein
VPAETVPCPHEQGDHEYVSLRTADGSYPVPAAVSSH